MLDGASAGAQLGILFLTSPARDTAGAMSEENLELARQYFDALNKGMDASEHLRHPDIEVFDPPDFPDADRYTGEPAVRKLIESYLELGWDGQYRVKEYLDAGDEVVVIWQAQVHFTQPGSFF